MNSTAFRRQTTGNVCSFSKIAIDFEFVWGFNLQYINVIFTNCKKGEELYEKQEIRFDSSSVIGCNSGFFSLRRRRHNESDYVKINHINDFANVYYIFTDDHFDILVVHNFNDFIAYNHEDHFDLFDDIFDLHYLIDDFDNKLYYDNIIRNR